MILKCKFTFQEMYENERMIADSKHCTVLHCPTLRENEGNRRLETLHCPTLSYTVLHCPTLSYTVLHCPTLSYTVLHCPTLSYTVLHCPTLSYTVLHCPTLSYTGQMKFQDTGRMVETGENYTE